MALDLDILLSQHDHNGADFICRVTGRKFYLGNEPGFTAAWSFMRTTSIHHAFGQQLQIKT